MSFPLPLGEGQGEGVEEPAGMTEGRNCGSEPGGTGTLELGGKPFAEVNQIGESLFIHRIVQGDGPLAGGKPLLCYRLNWRMIAKRMRPSLFSTS